MDETVECFEAISIKTTTVTDLTTWLSKDENKIDKHLTKLQNRMGINGPGFTGKKKTILYDTGKVIIAVEQQNLSKYGNWVSQLKTLYPSLNFEIITLESLIKP